MKFIKNIIFFKISIIFIIFILDQISKAYVINLFNEIQFNEIYILKFINIYLIWNKGIAFGLLNFDNGVIYNIITYLIIFISLLSWSFLDPSKNLWLVIAVGLGIAVSSATQDITIDALRIEQIGENEKNLLSAGAAMSVVGWWTGYKIGGLISLVSADILQKQGIENYWQISFVILSGIIVLCCIGLLFIPEKNSEGPMFHLIHFFANVVHGILAPTSI